MKAWIFKKRSLLLRVAGTIVAVGALIFLLHQEGWGEIADALSRIPLDHILLAFGLILISRLSVIARWYTLLRSGGIKIPFTRAASLTFTGLFASNFLPTTIGGDVVRLAGVMQAGYDRAVCLASIAADRLVGMAGMAMTAPIGLATLWQWSAQQSFVLPAFVGRLWDFSKRTLGKFTLWLKQPLALATALAFTWVHMLCTFGALYFLLDGLGSPVAYWKIAGLWSLTYFISLLPVSINGLGVQELSISGLLQSMSGVDQTVSLTLAVLIRGLMIIASLPGAAFLPAALADLAKDESEL
jgi:hypothetical protein